MIDRDKNRDTPKNHSLSRLSLTPPNGPPGAPEGQTDRRALIGPCLSLSDVPACGSPATRDRPTNNRLSQRTDSAERRTPPSRKTTDDHLMRDQQVSRCSGLRIPRAQLAFLAFHPFLDRVLIGARERL